MTNTKIDLKAPWLMRIIAVITALILIFCLPSHAGELQFRYGLGIEIPEPTYKGEVKHFSLAYQNELPPIFIEKTEIGMWADDNGNRQSSGYIAHSFGVRVKAQYIYAEALWGLSLISHPDNVFLSGHMQFMQDLGIGLIDELGRSIGVCYKHLSNAGIQLPNKGRDAIQIQVGIPAPIW